MRRENKESFIKLFKYHGYNIIPNKDISLKSTMRKIALYTNSSKTPTHAARQLSNGMWASKIGADIDLVHKTLDVLEGPAYGKVDIIFGKQKFEYISAEESEIINKSNILLKMKNIGNNRYKF
jgi:hypothetical protein